MSKTKRVWVVVTVVTTTPFVFVTYLSAFWQFVAVMFGDPDVSNSLTTILTVVFGVLIFSASVILGEELTIEMMDWVNKP